MGSVGCGAVSQVRSKEGGVRSERGVIDRFGDIASISQLNGFFVQVYSVISRKREVVALDCSFLGHFCHGVAALKRPQVDFLNRLSATTCQSLGST